MKKILIICGAVALVAAGGALAFNGGSSPSANREGIAEVAPKDSVPANSRVPASVAQHK